MLVDHEGGSLPDPRLELPLRSSADTDGEVRRVLSKLEAAGQDLKINRLLANSSATFRPYLLLASALMTKSALPPLERETVILHLAARRNVAYEWAEHVPMSKRAGVTERQREVLALGTLRDELVFSSSQWLVLRATDEIMRTQTLAPASWDEVTAQWGVEGGLDLVLTIAFWGGYVPLIIEAVGLQSPS